MGTIGKNYGEYQKHKYGARAELSKAQSKKTAANQQADKIEADSKADSHLAAMNMSRVAKNKNSATRAALTQRASSGFTDQGSANQPEIAIADAFDQAISDMSLSNAISDQNKRYAATATRYQGDLDMLAGEQNAAQMRTLGQGALGAAWAQAIATVVGGAAGAAGVGGATALSGAVSGYNIGGDLASMSTGAANQPSGYLSQYLAELAQPKENWLGQSKAFDGWMGKYAGIKPRT